MEGVTSENFTRLYKPVDIKGIKSRKEIRNLR